MENQLTNNLFQLNKKIARLQAVLKLVTTGTHKEIAVLKEHIRNSHQEPDLLNPAELEYWHTYACRLDANQEAAYLYQGFTSVDLVLHALLNLKATPSAPHRQILADVDLAALLEDPLEEEPLQEPEAREEVWLEVAEPAGIADEVETLFKHL